MKLTTAAIHNQVGWSKFICPVTWVMINANSINADIIRTALLPFMVFPLLLKYCVKNIADHDNTDRHNASKQADELGFHDFFEDHEFRRR